jgi:hypothetical protein
MGAAALYLKSEAGELCGEVPRLRMQIGIANVRRADYPISIVKTN